MVMNLKNLNIFVTVVEKGSFTQAAKHLYVSQPAISRSINALEADLGVRLFKRDKRQGLLLSDIGEKILVMARQMLELENKIYQTVYQENHLLGGKVTIASIPVMTTTILAPAMVTFQEKYPDVTIELIEGDARWVKEKVREHAADFGLTITPFSDLEAVSLVEDEMIAVSNALLQEPLDLASTDNCYIFGKAGEESAVDYLKGSHPIDFDAWMVVARGESVVSMAEHGVGVGVISEYTLNHIPNNLYRYSITPSVPMTYGIVAVDFDALTPVADTFVKLLVEERQAGENAGEAEGY